MYYKIENLNYPNYLNRVFLEFGGSGFTDHDIDEAVAIFKYFYSMNFRIQLPQFEIHFVSFHSQFLFLSIISTLIYRVSAYTNRLNFSFNKLGPILPFRRFFDKNGFRNS